MDDWLEPKPMDVLSGDEEFANTGLSVTEFWRWSSNDLRENVTRGILAEFLVAKAVGDSSETRVAWADHDVTSVDGIKIEVKSSAYLQSWRQRGPSRIVFSGLSSRSYSYETNEMGDEPEYSADVYVFAIQTCTDPEQYDPLDLESWCFYVLARESLVEMGSPKSVSKARLDKVGIEAVPYEGLAGAVRKAGAGASGSSKVGSGERWDEARFLGNLRKRYEDRPELAERMTGVYRGLVDAGAELHPGETAEGPSANLWLGAETDLPVAVSVYPTGMAINFAYVADKRTPDEMRRLAELISALPGTEPYRNLEAQSWAGRGSRPTIPPEQILPTDDAPDALIVALIEASLPPEG